MKSYLSIFLMTFLTLLGKSNCQNISFSPKSELINLNDGCTGVILNYSVSIGDVDSIIILPGFNTYMEYIDSLGNNEFIEKSMFLVNKENASNIYELYLCSENDTTILIPLDSSFFVDYANYYLKLIVRNENEIIDSLSQQFHSDWGLEVDEKTDAITDKFELKSNYPNPINPSTRISFNIPQNSNVKLEIFNIIGEKISTLISSKEYQPGSYTVDWNGTNQFGNQVPSGVYLYKLSAGKYSSVKKMMMIK